MRTSDFLTLGSIYTRTNLRERFDITDATIKNGIFRPRGHESIWLFVTEDKSPDMTQYSDELRGDDLFMDGQNAGRTDRMLIEHEQDGLEVILFYRRSRHEHEGSGFRYVGIFKYVEHQGSRPAHFHFGKAS